MRRSFWLGLVGILTVGWSVRSFAGDPGKSLHVRMKGKTARSSVPENCLHDSKPLSALPKYIAYRKGRISLFADFRHATDRKIDLYVINDTPRGYDLPHQDGDIYIKQEAKVAKGKWKRIQGHQYSGCGNSYFSRRPLCSGTFFKQTHSYFPSLGKEKRRRYPTRFKIYSRLGLLSNQGSMRADPDVLGKIIRGLRGDMFSIRQGDTEAYRELLLSPNATGRVRYLREMKRHIALRKLAEVSSKVALPLLKPLRSASWLDWDTFRLLYLALLKHDRKQTVAELTALLQGPSTKRRRFLEGYWVLLKELPRKTVISWLHHRAKDPKNPRHLEYLRMLTQTKARSLLPFFDQVMHDPAYAPDVRLSLRNLVHQVFGKKLIAVFFQISPKYGYKHRRGTPLPAVFALKNITRRTLRFSYSRPSDILAVDLYQSSKFLIPKKLDPAFTKPDPRKLRHVTLAPGKLHFVHLKDLLAGFTLPQRFATPNQPITVYLSVRLPKLHDIPQRTIERIQFFFLQ